VVNIDDRDLLIRLGRGACSGPELAAALGLGRAGVWKRIEALRRAGVPIEAVQGRGYQLQQPIELLDVHAIRAAMHTATDPKDITLDVLWEIDSTNAELLRCTPSQGTNVLFAERQTQGRGRRGRSWVSPLGAQLAFSVQRRFDGGIASLAGLSLAVGVAVAEGLIAAGYPGIGLKWPNDLVCDGRKLGGILIEFGGEYAGPVRAVIGIGINAALPDAAAAAIDQPWTDLRRIAMDRPGADRAGADCGIARNAIAAAVLDALLPALADFARKGLAPFLSRWERLDTLLGRAIDVLVDGRRESGIALGIADNGALRVRHADGDRLCHSAEVSVRPTPTEPA
jgi:BirA family biotin operon repressor/biotin-[acetyl-CoA-carboxylase] ligase